MKKLLPSFMLIFVFVISCISAVKAQVMELVSYTPSPLGSYNAISAKGNVQFAGDLDATLITAVGEQLNLTATTTLNNGSNVVSFTSGKDIYRQKAFSTINGLTVYQGQLNIDPGNMNNANNTNISGEIKGYPIISANNVSMSGADVSLIQDGVLLIGNVPMTNPYCPIKWINLPAYILDGNNEVEAGEYYFATCAKDVPDYDSSKPKYSCKYGKYQDCPCGQINIGGVCKKMRAYINETPAIAACSSGLDNNSALWNQNVQNTQKKCEFTGSGSTWTSKFRCSSFTIKTCQYPYYYTNEYSGLKTSAEMANPHKIYVRDTNSSAPDAQCGGAPRSGTNDVAREFNYTDDSAGTGAGSYISYPIQYLDIPTNLNGSQQTQLNNFKTSTFAMYCGFNSVPEILDAMQNNPECTIYETISPCPASVNTNKDFLTPAELCSMVSYNSFDSNNNFQCALDYPAETDFQAYRVINYNITTNPAVKQCEICNANGYNYCKSESAASSYNVAQTSSAWIKVNSAGHAEYTAEEILATDRNRETLLNLTNETKYLNKKITTRVLSCHIY